MKFEELKIGMIVKRNNSSFPLKVTAIGEKAFLAKFLNHRTKEYLYDDSECKEFEEVNNDIR